MREFLHQRGADKYRPELSCIHTNLPVGCGSNSLNAKTSSVWKYIGKLWSNTPTRCHDEIWQRHASTSALQCTVVFATLTFCHQFTWNLRGRSWKTIFLFKGTPCQVNWWEGTSWPSLRRPTFSATTLRSSQSLGPISGLCLRAWLVSYQRSSNG